MTATNIDFSHVLTDKLPVFIAVVVLLAFILLMAVFRSLLIPLTASIMNLLSVGAALGALNAVFNWGWGSSILRLSGTGPIDAFIPVLLFSVLFGLSMDYEVYLVSRIQEEWHHLHHTQASKLAALSGRAARRNHQAITTGQANWALPGWLDRILPRVAVEGGEQTPQRAGKTERTRPEPAETAK